jgi:hypothetical protein
MAKGSATTPKTTIELKKDNTGLIYCEVVELVATSPRLVDEKEDME